MKNKAIYRYINSDYWKLENGIWYGDEIRIETSFSDDGQNELLDIEEKSWWFQYRARVLLCVLERLLTDKVLFDVGGGNGYTSLNAKQSGYEVVLIEPGLAACHNAIERGIDNVCCGTANENSLNKSSIPQIMLLDVLEHIEDDESFLQTLNSRMIKGGRLLITVPAFSCLWSDEDKIAGHYRRYIISDIETLATKCGFSIIEKNYFMSFLFVPIVIVRVILEKLGIVKKYNKRSDEDTKKYNEMSHCANNYIVKSFLNIAEILEINRINKKRKIPFGSSLYVVLEKL